MAKRKAAQSTRYHKGNVRENLITAAEAVLQDEGLAALSLRRVAREVGVTPSAVYNHFRNREALLAAVAADGYDRLKAIETVAYAEQGDPEQVLRGLARDYLDFALENPNLYRLLFRPEVVSYRTHPELAQAGDSSFQASVEWWQRDAQFDPGVSAAHYPYAMATWTILHGLALQVIDGLVAVNTSEENSVDNLVTTVMDVFIDGAARGLPNKDLTK